MILNRWWHSFYPGIATADLQLIGSATAASVGAIDAPKSHTQASPDRDESASGVSASGRILRSPFVTGSFDHAILPMPPASAHFRVR